MGTRCGMKGNDVWTQLEERAGERIFYTSLIALPMEHSHDGNLGMDALEQRMQCFH